MDNSTTYYTTWIKPNKLDESWLPSFFDPVYESLDKEIDNHPEYYQCLFEYVEIESPRVFDEKNILSYRYHVVNQYGELHIEEIGNKSQRNPITVLPPEAIIIAKIVSHRLRSAYWMESYYPGGGLCSSNYMVIKPRGSASIAWIYNELQKEYCQKQIKRAATGAVIPQINSNDLLRIKIRKLSQHEIGRQNQVIQDRARSQSALGNAFLKIAEGQKAVKPFLLTGASFQERLSQFEENLQKQSIIDTNRLFFIEASTSNHKEDLFIVRHLGTQQNSIEALFDHQSDPELDRNWREWYWDSSVNKRDQIFNSMTAANSLPAYLLKRMLFTSFFTDDIILLKNSLLPSFDWFQSVLEYYQDGGEVNWEDAGKDLVEKWTGLMIETGHSSQIQRILSHYNLDLNNDYSRLSRETDFPYLLINIFRKIYCPAIGLKVIRDGKTAGIYLLFGTDQFERPNESRALLEGMGQSLSQILGQPSEMIDDATRRESLRRLSGVMHRLNGPVGRASSVIGELNDFIDSHADFANSLVPDEQSARIKSQMAEEPIENHTIKARLNDLSKAIDDIRNITYKIKRLQNAQGNLPRTKIDLNHVLEKIKSEYQHQVSRLRIIISVDTLPLYVKIHEESIFMAIEEVMNNACRELKEKYISDPEISINAYTKNKFIFLSIADNALPIDQNLISRPFDEDSSTYARKGRGSGLGLAIVKETFHSHEGDCSLTENIDSEGNRAPGIIFKAKLPKFDG